MAPKFSFYYAVDSEIRIQRVVCRYLLGCHLPVSSPFCPLCSVYMISPYSVVLVP